MAAPEAWVYRTAFNLARSRYRRRAAERRSVHRLAASTRMVSEPPDTASAVTLRELVSALPERQRAAIVARFYAGLTVDEAAERPRLRARNGAGADTPGDDDAPCLGPRRHRRARRRQRSHGGVERCPTCVSSSTRRSAASSQPSTSPTSVTAPPSAGGNGSSRTRSSPCSSRVWCWAGILALSSGKRRAKRHDTEWREPGVPRQAPTRCLRSAMASTACCSSTSTTTRCAPSPRRIRPERALRPRPRRQRLHRRRFERSDQGRALDGGKARNAPVPPSRQSRAARRPVPCGSSTGPADGSARDRLRTSSSTCRAEFSRHRPTTAPISRRGPRCRTWRTATASSTRASPVCGRGTRSRTR